MAKYVIDESTLVGIADAIRTKDGSSEIIPVAEIKNRIASLSAGANTCAGFPNGTMWSPSNVYDKSFNHIHEFGGMWVACSLNSGLWYSTDGKTWIQSNITSGSYNWCCYDAGKWCAVGSGALVSTDGINWTSISVAGSTYTYVHVCCSNGIWVMSSLGSGLHYYDSKMSAWGTSEYTPVSGMFYQVECINGLWVACGYGSGLHYSNDGLTWVHSNVTSGQFYRVHYVNGMWIATTFGSNLGVYYSVDGMTWTRSNLNNVSAYSACYGNDMWVVGCIGGIYYSVDGVTWSKAPNVDGNFQNVGYNDGIWVACSGNGIYCSTDGIDWVQTNINTGSYSYVHNANGIWVACSSDGNGMCFSVSFESTSGYFVDANNVKY